jgi:FkbM family methyltransferase
MANASAIDDLAALRGEARDATERFLAEMGRRMVPSNLIHPAAINALPITETGIDWPYAYVRLEGGKTFYSYPSKPTRLRQYWLIADKIPKTVSAHTFGAVCDAARRYAYRADDEPADMTGWTVIEAGAYIGLKAIRFAEKAGPRGKVIAVEIHRANCELMRLNIEANGLGGRIEPVHAAVSDACGDTTFRQEGYQRHSLVALDHIPKTLARTVQSVTLDALLDNHGLPHADYVNVQVNGAELSVLEGATPSRLRRLAITCTKGESAETRRLVEAKRPQT